MQTHPQFRDPNLKQPPPLDQGERFGNTKEQAASTAPAGEQAWLVVILGLVALVIGLYQFNDRRIEPPSSLAAVVVGDQVIVGSDADAVISEQSLDDQDSPASPWMEYLNTPPFTTNSQNETLLQRYYDQVLNRRHVGLMDELFADQVVYGYHGDGGATRTLNLAALKRMLKVTGANYVGLYYFVESITSRGDWVRVHWSAEGTPLSSGEQQVWSGYTVWKVVDGRITQMWTYLHPQGKPFPMSNYKTRLSGQLQDSQDVAEHQFHLSGGNYLP